MIGYILNPNNHTYISSPSKKSRCKVGSKSHTSGSTPPRWQDVDANPLRNTSKGAKPRLVTGPVGEPRLSWKMGLLERRGEDYLLLLERAWQFWTHVMMVRESWECIYWYHPDAEMTPKMASWGFVTTILAYYSSAFETSHSRKKWTDFEDLLMFHHFLGNVSKMPLVCVCVSVKSCDVNPGSDQFSFYFPDWWTIIMIMYINQLIQYFFILLISDIGEPPHICSTMLCWNYLVTLERWCAACTRRCGGGSLGQKKSC